VGLGGHLTGEPSDFIVDEIPAYDASGQGDHVYINVRKVGLTTPELVKAFANSSGCAPSDIGVAGRKDKWAVTSQWLSLPVEPVEPDDDRIRLIETKRHNHKLRRGHLRGNRFRIKMSGLTETSDECIQALLSRLDRGVPNYYGHQRFGIYGDGPDYSLSQMRRRSRRKTRDLRFSASVVQGALFNIWLGRRVNDGLFHTALSGDVYKKVETGGLFSSETPQIEQLRLDKLDIDPTGPIYGPKMRAALAEAGQREIAVRDEIGLTEKDWATLGRLGKGSRRLARVRPQNLKVEVDGRDLFISFELPSGSYATVILAELTHTADDLKAK